MLHVSTKSKSKSLETNNTFNTEWNISYPPEHFPTSPLPHFLYTAAQSEVCKHSCMNT